MTMSDRPKAQLQDSKTGQFARGNPGGAPRRMLTPERRKTIVKHVRNGNYLSVAARAAGVGGGAGPSAGQNASATLHASAGHSSKPSRVSTRTA